MVEVLNPRTVSVSEILRHFGESNGAVAVDTESGKQRGLLGISMDNGRYNTYLPVNHYDIDNMAGCDKEYLSNYLQRVDSSIYHNSPYDIDDVLIPNGFLDEWPKKFWDTINMSHWINENRISYALDDVAKSFKIKGKAKSRVFEAVTGMEDGWDDVPFDEMFPYSSQDARATYGIWELAVPEFITQGFAGELWEWEMGFLQAMKRMKNEGIRIDPTMCAREIFKGQGIMDECKVALGFKPNETIGPKNLSVIFFERLGFPVVKRTPKGQPCFDKEAMKQYDEFLQAKNDQTAKTVLRYRGWQKTVSANYKAYLKYSDSNSILHPGYKLHGTVTGRISCADPALQQIPRETEQEWNGDLKKAFVAKEGYDLWELDYSQLEFRLQAVYGEDQNMIDIFNDPTRDYFSEMSAAMGYPRHQIKTFQYASSYDAKPRKIGQILGIGTNEAQKLFNSFATNYPGVVKVRSDARRLAESRGYVKYWTGRRRHFESPSSEGRKAFNSIIQGGGAEIIKRAIVRIDREVCDQNCKLILQVHDSVVAEIRRGHERDYLPRIQYIMEDVRSQFSDKIKFKVDVKPWPKADTKA